MVENEQNTTPPTTPQEMLRTVYKIPPSASEWYK